jgi:lipopolysaccharide export system permease protein
MFVDSWIRTGFRCYPVNVRILRRYIFLEVLVATIGAMALFCLILITGNVLRELASRLADGRLTLGVFFQLFGLLIPYVFSFSLPLGFLTGVLIGLGRLSSNREIIAMKTTGNSLFEISLPVLILALLGSTLMVWTNNYLAPVSRTRYKALMVEALRADPLRFFKTGVLSREFPGYVFFLQEKTGSELKGFWLWELDPDDRPAHFVRSDSGSIRYERDRDSLILTLRNGVAESWPSVSNDADPLSFATVFFEEFPIELPLGYSLKAAKVKRILSEYSLDELRDMLSGKMEFPEEGLRDPDLYRQRIRVQISNNFSLAASLLALSMVAIPLAIRTGRKETYANAMLALALGLIYYFFVSMIASLEIPQHFHPVVLVWIPNVIVIGIGVLLMRRVYQH